VADRFVRVRLPRIDNLDLRLFEFDYDLTMMIFFLDSEDRVYARYGGRDGDSAEKRQSLDGLRHTMQSVLRMHENANREFVPQSPDAPRSLREVLPNRRGGRCLHCHEVKEAINADLRRKGRWTGESPWRYPLPDNLGLVLDVDRGGTVKTVAPKSPAALLGLKPGDVVHRLNGLPVHSFSDAQVALDRAPKSGSVEIAWRRDGKVLTEKLSLPEGWRRTDLTWRPSMSTQIPSLPLYGKDLSDEEKKALGLPPKRLAFRQKEEVSTRARAAGFKGGDIILGVDGKELEMDVIGLLRHVQRNYLLGDQVRVNILREGKPLAVPLTLGR
jgi:serine protease Do